MLTFVSKKSMSRNMKEDAMQEILKTVDTDMMVGVIGDTHGDTLWTMDAIKALHSKGVRVILHVGDFGFWPGKSGARYVRKVNKVLTDLDMIMLITLGNHEDYSQTGKAVQVEGMPVGFTHLAHVPRLIILSRPTRWGMGERSFLSVGGANSIDYQGRTLGKDYWLEEQITDEDVDNARVGGYADVMVTHDTATGVMGDVTDSADEWTDEGYKYAQRSSDQVKRIMDEVQPRVNLFGHYHMWMNRDVTLRVPFVGEYTVRAVCMDMQWRAGNTGVFDLDSLTVEPIKVNGV